MGHICCPDCSESVTEEVDSCPHCGCLFNEDDSFEYDPEFGCVYVLSNAVMPGLLKIGFISRDPNERAQELSSATGIPESFKVECFYQSNKAQRIERVIHKELDKYRLNSQREFFKATLEEVIPILNKYFGSAAVRYIAKSSDIQESDLFTDNADDGYRRLKNHEIWRSSYICTHCGATLRLTHSFCLGCGREYKTNKGYAVKERK